MADIGNFDKLVSGLSLDERQNLLSKLKSQSILTNEPLYTEEKVSASIGDFAVEFSKLPWFTRVWYYLMSLFKTKAPVKIFEDNQIALLGEKINETFPGLYDYHRNQLSSSFCRHTEKLKEAARFFYSALDISVNRDKGSFFAFLGSLEMPSVHRRLLEETDPAVIMEKQPEMPETEMRQMALKTMDNALSLITEEYRNIMYFNARSLNCLKELSSFLFDRLLMAFGTGGGGTCSVGVIRDLLVNLNNILLSMKIAPPMTLLESLFVFILHEKADEPGFDINREIRGLLTKAENSLAVIREFNKQVPLTLITRCATRDMSLSPKEISGGEDWFMVYRDYWKRRIESLLAGYLKTRRRQELENSFRSFLKGQGLKVLENTASDANPDGLPIKGDFALSFLNTFYSVVFMPEINRILRPILIDGEFHNRENRVEFTESYNNLIKLEDDIKMFDREISPSGEYGKRYIQARQDMISLQIKRRKVQIVLDEAEEDAENILEAAKEASRSMVNILDGLRGQDNRGKYGTLSNFSAVAGKNNQFAAGLDDTIEKFQRVVMLLDDMEIMEEGR